MSKSPKNTNAERRQAEFEKSKKAKTTQIQDAAQKLANIEFGDFGTLGGNVAPDLTDFVLSLKGAERISFTEYYLSELRVRLLSVDFNPNPRS